MNINRKKHFFSLLTLLALLLLCVIIIAIVHQQIEKELYPRHYANDVRRYAEQYDVPEHLIYAVIRTESNFDRDAVSSAGAIGLMQIMPDTFEWLTNYQLFDHFELGMCYDAQTNIRYGVYYLRWLYDRYGRWNEACAAYNAGPGRVDEWLTDASLTDEGGALIPENIPFSETRAYVKKVHAAQAAYDRLYPSADHPSY